MGLDCKLNGKHLDRWYVFDRDFQVNTLYDKEEMLEKLGAILIKLSSNQYSLYNDTEYYIFWISKALLYLKDFNNVFLNENCEEYYDDEEND